MNVKGFRFVCLAGVLAAQTLFVSQAQADAGDGLRSEQGWELTPSLTLSGAYNSNVFRASPDETASVLADAPILGIEPAVVIESPRERDFLLDLDAGLHWDQYFDVSDGGASRNVGRQSGLSAFGGVTAQINPDGQLSLKLDETITRKNVPSSYGGSEPYNWLHNNLGGVVGISPGAGVLGIDLGYHWGLYIFDNDSLAYLDRDEHKFDLDIHWDFLPKTSLLVNADFRLIRWDKEFHEPGREDLGFPSLRNVDHNPLRLTAGLSGLLTQRIALRALAGYGWSMHDEGSDFSGVLADVGLAYTFGRLDLNNKMGVGYRRDFRTASVGNFFAMHQVYANYVQHMLDKRMSLKLGGRFEWRDYSEESAVTYGEPLKDELLIGEAGLGIKATDWLGFNIDYALTANLTDSGYSLPAFDPTDPNITVLRDYVQHIATLSMKLQY